MVKKIKSSSRDRKRVGTRQKKIAEFFFLFKVESDRFGNPGKGDSSTRMQIQTVLFPAASLAATSFNFNSVCGSSLVLRLAVRMPFYRGDIPALIHPLDPLKISLCLPSSEHSSKRFSDSSWLNCTWEEISQCLSSPRKNWALVTSIPN